MAKPTYLFIWNKWVWATLEQDIQQLKITGEYSRDWNCSRKRIEEGDRAFLIKIGNGKNIGIVGSGHIIQPTSFPGQYEGKPANKTTIKFDVLLNPDTDRILSIKELNQLNSMNVTPQNWRPPKNGNSIYSNDPEALFELETKWNEITKLNSIQEPLKINKNGALKHTEGNPYEIILTRYERNLDARNDCLNHHGYSCSVCKINFKQYYGQIGEHFIHVHHLTSIAEIKESYIIDPIKDLIPVCPNCHAMLHKKNPPYTIEELKLIIKKL